MTTSHQTPSELQLLLEALCEDRLTADDVARLEQLVFASPEAMWTYLTYLELHGTLYWDAAGAGLNEPLSSQEIPVYHVPVDPPASPALVVSPSSARPRRAALRWATSIAACAILAAGVFLFRASQPDPQIAQHHAEESPEQPLAAHANGASATRTHGPPVNLELPGNQPIPQQSLPDRLVATAPTPMSNREIVSKINDAIESRWTELQLQPSERSQDAEWMRRVYLDLIGRVPTVDEARGFLADQSGTKRQDLVDRLLSDMSFARNFTTKWSNLLVGRAPNPLVNRESLQKFLRQSFAQDRPWNEVVADLISAEGSNDDVGATNFLIAHLNNDATPATAVVARVFLGQQIQCNQCHNNPFNESKQIAFWEMNSFFQQTTSVVRQRRDPVTGRMSSYAELVTRDAGGPTYFETNNGFMRVAYPRFDGHDIDASAEINRRRELARLMTSGDQRPLATAFVNRTWEHFLGASFTHTVDDLGPHQPVSHPELLALLSEQFVRSGYDVKQLIRWVCQSEAYQLTSRFSDNNQTDDPETGELPAFSRMYVKSMTAEQTFDSLMTATHAHQVGAVDWGQAEQTRQSWMKQFVVSYQTDENDESMAFEGTVGNALSLMNGPLIDKALADAPGSFLGDILRQKSSDADKIRTLCLATISRPPAANELAAMRRMIHDAAGTGGNREAYQDLFWALLNSNEFALVH